MGIYSSKGLPCQLIGKVAVGIILCIVTSFYGAQANAATATVCYKTGSELDLDKTINANSRAKLSNPAYFGPAGTAAPETLIFTTMATVNASTLVSNGCDIFYGGGSPALSLTEATDVQNWTQNAVDRFVLAGCDYSWNRICSVFGRGLTANSNGGVTIVPGSALSFNALGCGGALTVGTYGGASTYHGTLPGDIIMATHNGAPAGQTAAVITDGAVNGSTFLFSADADMYGSSGSSAIGAGPTASTDQAKFVVNSFKYALDVVRDRMDNPTCVDDYDETTDLAISSSLASSTLSVGQQTTVTFTVSNQSTTSTNSIAAELILPAGLSYVSQSGSGTYSSGTNAWTIGTLAGGASVSITLTVQAITASVGSITGEITNANLADVDSATNSSFNADDKADGVIDDDETTESITIIAPPPEDYGDAPATYGDAPTEIDSSIHLGSAVPDSETTGSYDYRALGDGNEEDGAPQSQWGVNLFPLLLETDTSYSVPIKVKNTSGGAATLEAWIDFDYSGTFEADEKTTMAVANSTTGTVSLNWASIPTDISNGTTFIRLRITNDTTGAGEVEDHVIGIAKSIPPESPNVTVTNETVKACQAVIFEDDFDDLTDYTYLSPNRIGSVAIRDWTTTGGGQDTYARVQTDAPGDQSIYLGNGAVRRISPPVSSLSFDSNGRLTTVINAIELRMGPDDTTPGTTTNSSSWGPDEVVFSRTFASVAGETYRLYFTAVPEGGSWSEGIMRVDTPVGSAHFKAPASGTGQVNYAIEFTATSNSSTIAFANYGHIGPSSGGWCNPQHPTDMGAAAWCTQDGVSSGSGTNEVIIDDIYLVEAACDTDYSDAPLTATSYGDASHSIINDIHLGAAVSAETVGYNDPNAAGDADDGVLIPTLIQGETARIDVNVTQVAANDGYLQAWIDWNGDGDFADSGEQIATDQQHAAGVTGTIELPITVPSSATTSQTFARFRWSTTAGLDTTTAASDGEVEDYALTILPDTPPFPPGPGLGSSVCEATTPASAYDNRAVAWEHNSPPNTLAPAIYDSAMVATAQNYAVNGLTTQIDQTFVHVDFGSTTASYDANKYFEYEFKTAALPSGVTEVVGVGAGLYERTQASHDSKSGHYRFAVLIDDDPAFGSPDVLINNAQIKDADSSYADTTWGPFNIGHSIFHYAHYDVNGTAVQLASNTDYKVRVYPYAISATGSSVSSVVPYSNLVLWDDFGLKMVNCAVDDYGDAPDSYGTTDASGGAKHSVSNDVFLGTSKPDPDADGVPGLTADSDDTNAGGDDEDGVATLPTLSHLDNSYSITVNATNTTATTARLIAWIDFDGNGTFDNDEAAVRTVPAGTTAGSIVVNWSSIPADIQQGNTYLRLRFTTDSIHAGEAKGPKLDGEVEDYAMTITSSGASVTGRVYIDANSSTSQDAGEAGIGGTVVVLYDTLGNTCQSVSTDANGDYSFNGIPDGGYEVYQSHGDTTPVPQNCGSSFANNPTGYQSTTADILSFMVLSADVADQDFGEVAGANSPTSGNTGVGILFEPDHQSEVLPGNVAFYAHTFSTEADGEVSFTTAASGNTTNGWTHALYQDSDCNGTLDGSEGSATINGTLFPITAGNRVCLINKVYAPPNVPAQDQYLVEITAAFDYAGGNLPPVTLEVSDLTIAGEAVSPTTSATPAVGESRLVLRKSVENITQGAPETKSLSQANPGDFLKYRIYYRNTGTGPITDLHVDDTVPAFTGLVTGSNTCDVTPTGMTCTATVNIDELNWSFTGSLAGGAEGHVSYQVMVDN